MCALLGLILLSGCGAISKKECLSVDWQTRGYTDGRAGFAVQRVQKYIPTCARVEIVPDAIAYARGHAAGIPEYCTAQNALVLGENDANYRGVCPADLEPGFALNFIRGLKVRRDDLELEYDQLDARLEDARFLHWRLDSQADRDVLDRRIEHLRGRLSDNRHARWMLNIKISRLKRLLY